MNREISPQPLAKTADICYNNMNIYVPLRFFGGREVAVWLSIDRIEENTVVLIDESERVYTLARDAYIAMVGRVPAESDVLSATLADGRILSASYDEAETESRKAAARARLNRLFGRG